MNFILKLSAANFFIMICILICVILDFDFHRISLCVGWIACMIYIEVGNYLNKTK